MVALQKLVTIQAFKYTLAKAPDLESGRDPEIIQWERLEVELPDFEIYDVDIEDEAGGQLLTIVQRWYVDGERSNIAHALRPEDWLVQDITAEGNYRVINPVELQKFLKG